VFTQTCWTVRRPSGNGEAAAKVYVPNSIIEADGREAAASVLRNALSVLRSSIRRGETIEVYYGIATVCFEDDGDA